MKNILYNINKNGLPVIPVLSPCPESDETTGRQTGFSRALYLSVLALVAAITGILLAKAISWITGMITSWVFYGNNHIETTSPANHNLNAAVILIPVAGALLFVFITRHTSPFLKALATTIGIGTGAPMGIESPVMMAGGALGAWIGKLFRLTPTENYILFVAGVCSGMSWLFGAPLAAIFLALEVLLTEWTLCSILPVIMGSAVGAVSCYFFRGADPVYNMTDGPAGNLIAIVAYTAAGLLIGLLSVLIIKSSGVIQQLFEKLTGYSKWFILLAALVVGITGYYAPETLGDGNSYINDLLHAHVTLSLLFMLSVMKLVSWLFFSGGNQTGSGITPVLIIGGAIGLLIGVIIQLAFPSVVINSAVAVLIGMSAMFAGTSRALLTAVIFAVEITHHTDAALPLSCACLAAYSSSFFLLKKKRKADERFALS
ncbi:voltage-gated chloride channel [Chitinophaga niastensis]|uniref:Voltage-gated chloride channel n=1 Tax=Chitinophaga niastensis TaxID=536980 RepID=A0A2P8HTL0_CHINA|nr:chloride channel protein [Chitinophaga niastensis]PSL49566.1 voltage-gated chloride channel [Chitinophaga niastensis]